MAQLPEVLQRALPWVFAAVVLLSLFGLTLWKLPERQVKDFPSDTPEQRMQKAKQEDEYRRTLAQIVGGAFLVFGAVFTYCSMATARETLKATQDAQITERFARAITQLGAKELELKLGGIYSLERLARQSDPQDHWTIIEVLTAYVREHARRPPRPTAVPIEPVTTAPARQPVTADIQAILTVIGRRTRLHGEGEDLPLDLSQTALYRARLRGATLTGADLTRADLTQADLTGADLTEATLAGAVLAGAVLTGADLIWADLTEATLFNATLTEAALTEAFLFRTTLVRAALTGADLAGAILTGADLSETDLTGAVLSEADLTGAVLTGARGLIQEQINAAQGNEQTQIPNHLTRPAHWLRRYVPTAPDGRDAPMSAGETHRVTAPTPPGESS
jgi:uncharacterized protein YjbI with pentapeptide repeats